MSIKTVEDGVRSVLLESVEIATQSGLLFSVIGGWSPVLLNSSPVPHPGTRDVDLLFCRGTEVGALRKLLENFRSKNYFVSAKHPFQLIRILEVGGADLAFNVDILHPLEGRASADLFVEHLELDVEINRKFGHQLKLRSIATPMSQFIFDEHLVGVPLTSTSADGSHGIVTVPVMDEIGLLVTKSAAVRSPKRTRDALDIFFAVVQARDLDAVASMAAKLREYAAEVYATLLDLATRIADRESKFHQSLEQAASDHDLVPFVNDQLIEFQDRFSRIVPT